MKYRYNKEAFGGMGGHCFFIDARPEVSDQVFENFYLDGIFDNEYYFVKKVQMQSISGEATHRSYDFATIDWELDETNRLHVDSSVRILRTNYYRTADYQIKWALEGFFFILFFVNNTLFLNAEYQVYQRFRSWHRFNIESLSKIELEERSRYKPEWARRMNLFLRFTNAN